jgi:tetratricopeptide (TPR) repeat protein
MYLDPLSEEAMKELLSGLVPGLPEELRAQILARAEGIPLYAVETVRMLLDRGTLVQEGSVYRPAGTIESLEVPETLHALIAARLDGLPASERRIVQDAAVLGKTFTKQALAALAELPEAELDPLLVSLTRKEILGVQADPRSPERGQYGFLQDLLRKVAYETLSKADRKTRHLAAAAYLEQALGEQEVVQVVASHYLDAYRAAPDAPDAPEIKATAGEQLARAGERAASLGANEEAERYFAQAAELADDPLAKADLEEQAGRSAWRGGVRDEARFYLDRAHAVFEAEGLTGRAARISAALADVDYRDGHLSEAVARLESALKDLADEEPNESVAIAAAQLGRYLVLNNRNEEAAPHLELALALAEALRLPEVFCQALTSKAILYTARDRLEEARILLEGALDRALANDLHAAATRTFNNLAVTYESADRFRDAADSCARAIELARRVGDRFSEENFVNGPISAFVLLGDWDEAVARASGDNDELPETLLALRLPLVYVECARGDVADARRRIDRLSSMKESEDPQVRLGYAAAEAHVLRAEGRLRDAFAAAESGTTLSSDLGATFLNIKLCHVEALEAAHALGDSEKVTELIETIEQLRPGERPPLLEAHGHRFRSKLSGEESGYRAAAALFRDLEMPFWLGVTLLEHGEATGSDALLAEARRIFGRIGATPWLERAGGLRAEEEAEVTA